MICVATVWRSVVYFLEIALSKGRASCAFVLDAKMRVASSIASFERALGRYFLEFARMFSGVRHQASLHRRCIALRDSSIIR